MISLPFWNDFPSFEYGLSHKHRREFKVADFHGSNLATKSNFAKQIKKSFQQCIFFLLLGKSVHTFAFMKYIKVHLDKAVAKRVAKKIGTLGYITQTNISRQALDYDEYVICAHDKMAIPIIQNIINPGSETDYTIWTDASPLK
jgi:hypothetical protein